MKEWRLTPSRFKELPLEDQATIMAYERTRAMMEAYEIQLREEEARKEARAARQMLKKNRAK